MHLKNWVLFQSERLKAGEGDDRGWDGWMASLTRWTWVWVNSGSWWRWSVHGVARSQTLLSDWTELNWIQGQMDNWTLIWRSDCLVVVWLTLSDYHPKWFLLLETVSPVLTPSLLDVGVTGKAICKCRKWKPREQLPQNCQ